MRASAGPNVFPHGGQLRAIARQFHVAEESLLDFSASISPFPPPDEVLEKLRRHAGDSGFLARYPDLLQEDLKAAISAYASVPFDAIVAGNGMMPILQAALHALKIQRCLVLEPSFGGYRTCLEAARIATIAMDLRPEENFLLCSDEILASLDRTDCDAVLLANPHSPSGIGSESMVLGTLSQECAARGVRVLLDEAFIDFEPSSSLCPFAAEARNEERNLIVFRSLTKFFAIPALRVAYCIAGPGTAAMISKAMPEWAISSLDSLAAIELMACTSHQRLIQEKIPILREELAAATRALGISIFPSNANYLLARMESEAIGIAVWQSLIADHRIVVRSCQNFSGLDGSYLRFSVRTQKDNDTLVAALRATLAQTEASEPSSA